jgi:hypothetical protein
MPKRTPLQGSNLFREAAEARRAADNLKELKKLGARQTKELRSKRPPVADEDDYVTSAIHVRKWVLALLRHVAVSRANRTGGRPSVSALITELVERHREELEEERD